jgi:DNA-binding transcriptional LysR family regulator
LDVLKSMETFTRIVELGNYNRAAKELGVTPAMVSKRVLDLEASLGAKLLNRNSHVVSLTTLGAEYYQECVAVVSKVRAIHESIVDGHNAARGDLKIICAKTFGERVLSEILSEFMLQHPGVRVSLVLKDMTVKTEDLILEGFDLLIQTRAYTNALDSSLVMKKIVSLPRILVASEEYLRRRGSPKIPEDLRQHNCLNPNGFPSEMWHLSRGDSETEVRVSGFPLANSSAVIRTACERGLGIAMLSQYTVDDLVHNKHLSVVLPEFEIPSRALFVFYSRTRYMPVRTRLFIDFLSSWMRRWKNAVS